MFALRAVQSLLGPLSLSLQTEQAPADYRRRFSVVSVEAMQALRMAHAAGGLSGLVLDPFTDPVSLPFQTADIMVEMPSSLSPDGAADEA